MKNYNTKNLWDVKEYDHNLMIISNFNYLNISEISLIKQLAINLSFKSISFRKIRSIFFFFFLELITNLKPNLNKSKKNNTIWKIKQGSVVSCHVNLRKLNLINFLNYFSFTLTQLYHYKNMNVDKIINDNINTNAVSCKFNDLFNLYQLKQDYDSKLEYIQLTFKLNTINHFEKMFLLTLYKLKLF